jgi:hypothetical protein
MLELDTCLSLTCSEPYFVKPRRSWSTRIVRVGFLLSALMIAGGCSEPECAASEIKVGNVCRKLSSYDGGGNTTDSAVAAGCDAGGCAAIDASYNPQAEECNATNSCADGFICRDGLCRYVPPQRLPSSLSQTGGSTLSTSSQYRLRWSVGSALPQGTASSEKHLLSAQPRAAQVR